MSIKQVLISDVLTDAKPGFACGKHDDNGVVQIRMNNIGREGSLDLTQQRRVPTTEKGIAKCLAERGDVLFNATNSPELVGKSAYFEGYSEPVTFSNHFIRLRPKRDMLEGKFLAYWLVKQFQAGVFRGLCRQWVNQATVSREALLSLPIPLPPLSEQKRIAEILDRAEALRAKRRAALALLDELTQSIFLDMFGDPVTNPKCWPIKSLEEAGVKTKTGPFGSLLHKSDYIQGGVPLVNPKHMIAGTIEHDGDETVAESKAKKLFEYRVQIGDLLMARRGEMGRCAIVHETHDGWLCGTGSFFIRAPANIYLAEFLESTLSSHPMRKHLENLSGGAIMPSLSGTQIKSLRLPLPPIGTQRTFVETVKARGRQLDLQKRHSEELDALFASLQHRAFRGEL